MKSLLEKGKKTKNIFAIKMNLPITIRVAMLIEILQIISDNLRIMYKKAYNL